MRSAERRALVILGVTAIIASIFSAMLATIWVHQANETSFVFNVPPVNSPIPHATYFPFYVLEYWIIFWIAYAFCEFVYFSADWVSWNWRRNSHKTATVLMGLYVIYICTFVPLTTLDVIYVKDPNLQFDIFLLIFLVIGIIEADFVFWAWGDRRTGIIRRIITAYRRRRYRLPEWKSEGD